MEYLNDPDDGPHGYMSDNPQHDAYLGDNEWDPNDPDCPEEYRDDD